MKGTILAYRGILPNIADSAFVAPGAFVIGDVAIGAGSNIWFGCVIRGDVNIVRIGERTNLQDGTVIHVSRKRCGTHIGNDITVGHMALLHACTLEDGCFIGMRATIMDESIVEEGAMVAAGALVTPGKRVGRNELWAGVPARRVREMSADERAEIAETAPHYVRLAGHYLDAELGRMEPDRG